jgi:hypothetical protein
VPPSETPTIGLSGKKPGNSWRCSSGICLTVSSFTSVRVDLRPAALTPLLFLKERRDRRIACRFGQVFQKHSYSMGSHLPFSFALYFE